MHIPPNHLVSVLIFKMSFNVFNKKKLIHLRRGSSTVFVVECMCALL